MTSTTVQDSLHLSRAYPTWHISALYCQYKWSLFISSFQQSTEKDQMKDLDWSENNFDLMTDFVEMLYACDSFN